MTFDEAKRFAILNPGSRIRRTKGDEYLVVLPSGKTLSYLVEPSVQIKNLRKENKDLKERLDRLIEKNEKKASEIDELTEKIRRLDQELGELRKKLRNSNSLNDEEWGFISEWRNALTEAKSSVENRPLLERARKKAQERNQVTCTCGGNNEKCFRCGGTGCYYVDGFGRRV